ncbi:MAG: ATP-dependent helicase, partial [Clostridia bacterium]
TFGWSLINDDNRKDLFMDMVIKMDMSYSYKPVLLKAILLHADKKGRVKLSDIVEYFREFYANRKICGLNVEKANSIFVESDYTDKGAEKNILANPFKRFEDMQMLRHTKTLGIIEVDSSVWKNLSNDDKEQISKICDEKLEKYFKKLDGKRI